MGMLPEIFRRRLFERFFDRERGLSGGKPGAVRNTENMRVDGDGGDAKRFVQHHIGRLAPDAGQRFKGVTIIGYFAAMPVDQDLRGEDRILRLGVEQSDRLDVFLQPVFAQREHLSGRRDRLEQLPGRLVDPDIGRLRGQSDGDEQRVGIDVIELGLRFGNILREPRVELVDIGFLHSGDALSVIHVSSGLR